MVRIISEYWGLLPSTLAQEQTPRGAGSLATGSSTQSNFLPLGTCEATLGVQNLLVGEAPSHLGEALPPSPEALAGGGGSRGSKADPV